MKKFLLIILSIFIFLLISISTIYICYLSNDDIKADNNIYMTDLSKKVEVNNLIFSDTSFEKTINGSTQLYLIITNETDKDIQLSGFYVLLKDKEGNIIESIECYGNIVKKGVSFSYSALITSNIDDIYCIEYVEF